MYLLLDYPQCDDVYTIDFLYSKVKNEHLFGLCLMMMMMIIIIIIIIIIILIS